MNEAKITTSDAAKQRQRALARWDNEGGAGPDGPQMQDQTGDEAPAAILSGHVENEQLRIRIIALESLMIALLTEATKGQRDLAREMANHILPEPGATQHPLTIRAARQMLNMIVRAEHFTVTTQPEGA